MKYENFDKAEELVKGIKQLNKDLEKLDSEQLQITINENRERGRIFSIDFGFDHPKMALAKKFILEIKTDIMKNIEALTKELEAL